MIKSEFSLGCIGYLFGKSFPQTTLDKRLVSKLKNPHTHGFCSKWNESIYLPSKVNYFEFRHELYILLCGLDNTLTYTPSMKQRRFDILDR